MRSRRRWAARSTAWDRIRPAGGSTWATRTRRSTSCKNPLHAMLAELRRSIGGARLHMPGAGQPLRGAGAAVVPAVGAAPGRSSAPSVVSGTAFDGRFRLDGHLTTRVSGESMIGLKVGRRHRAGQGSGRRRPRALGGRRPAGGGVRAGAGAPALGRRERADHGEERRGSRPATAAARVDAPSRWPPPAGRSGCHAAVCSKPAGEERHRPGRADRHAVERGRAAGVEDWYGPLFLDTRYTHRRKRFNDAWPLPPEYVETIDRDPVVLPGSRAGDHRAAGRHRQRREGAARNRSSPSSTLDPYGKPIPKKPPPDGVDAQTFDEIDIVSASLTKMDDALFADGRARTRRVRAHEPACGCSTRSGRR